ncbi:MAG: hypothetical protein KDD73_08805 [Anaerolineales bacterium]|nr:hypothetical protein [Anaerolineales bacterium]
MAEPTEVLDSAFQLVANDLDRSLLFDEDIQEKTEYVARNLKNRAVVRLLMACLLAKSHIPHLDVRKPYTKIPAPDAFSGRSYDEQYLTAFIRAHNLPCNSTTAFLTPALRNRNATLDKEVNLVGRPPRLYKTVLSLLDDVHKGRVQPELLLAETIRWLLVMRDERQQRINSFLQELETVTIRYRRPPTLSWRLWNNI